MTPYNFFADNKIKDIIFSISIRRHPDKRPIIVIDFFSLAHPMVMQYDKESVCGGRHQKSLNAWKKLLDAFKATGCSLVFIADLNIQETKIDEWLNRRNAEFNGFAKIYDAIDNGENCPIKVAKKTSKNILQSLFHGMTMMAQSYGRIYHSIRHEADLEIAHYANQHKAMAIISNDSDFLIFKGFWRLWSSTGIVQSKLRLRTIEYNRKSIERILSLSIDQLPLFASLVGNDITNSKSLSSKLDNFFRKIGSSEQKIRNVAKFVRDLKCGINFKRISDNNIRQIVEKIFGQANGTWEQLIKSSIDSYNVDYSPPAITDPIEAKLSHSDMYRPYMENTGSIQVIIMSYYDLRGCAPDTSLPELLTDWMKRRKGILMMNGTKDPSNTFTVLVKRNFEEKCMAHTESLIYPNCKLTFERN